MKKIRRFRKILAIVLILILASALSSLNSKNDRDMAGKWTLKSGKKLSFDVKLLKNNMAMLSFKHPAPVKRIVFHGLNTSLNRFEIAIEELPGNNIFKRIYSVDFSTLEFDYAEITVNATGSQLFKCMKWNSTKKSCEIKRICTGNNSQKNEVCSVTGGWRKIKDITPGKEYSITVTKGDPGFAEAGAIYCTSSPCIANSSLLMSRDNIAPTPESNQPNTIDSCSDGTSGQYLVDESVENITITDLNSSVFNPGDSIRVDAWVHCWNLNPSADIINFAYANNTEAANWRVMSSVTCPGPGFQLLTSTWELDKRFGNHSIRVSIQYNGDPNAFCGAGNYDDNDDVSIFVGDYKAPLILNPAFNESLISPGEYVKFNVSTWDESGVSSAIATFRYPNGSEVNKTLVKVNKLFWENSTDLEQGEREAKAGVPPTDYSPKTCSQEWGFDCGTGPPEVGGNNTFDACPTGVGNDESVEEIYLSATAILPGDSITVTCEFDPYLFPGDEYYIYYFDGASWTRLRRGRVRGAGLVNRSATFTAGSNIGKHWVRCIIDWNGENDNCANAGSWYDNDDVSFDVVNITGPDNDGSAPFVSYSYTSGLSYLNVTEVRIKLTVSYYNPLGSINANNTLPDLEIGVYNGSDYREGYYMNLSSVYGNSANTTDANFTLMLKESNILNAWKDPENRKFKVRGVYLDTEAGGSDAINWTNAWIEIQYENGTEFYYIWRDTSDKGVYNVTSIYASDSIGNLNASQYDNLSFTVFSPEIIDITLYNAPINFGNLNPGEVNKSALANNGFPLTVSIEPTTNVNTNITLKAGDFLDISTGASFEAGNMSYSNESNGMKTEIKNTYLIPPPYSNWINIPPPMLSPVNRSIYFWISIPKGQKAGNYVSNVTIMVYSW